MHRDPWPCWLYWTNAIVMVLGLLVTIACH